MPDPTPDPAAIDERPRPTVSRADALLRTLVISWDLDDEIAFEATLTQARGYIGMSGSFPRSGTIRRKES